MRFLSFLRPLIATAAFMAAAAGAHAADFKNGLDYNTVDLPTRPDTGKKVEVLEVFMYHCPHCNALDAPLADWVKKQGDKIVFRRMHLGQGLLHAGSDERAGQRPAREVLPRDPRRA
jgi:thiol:disulfide interchange protein DsbA